MNPAVPGAVFGRDPLRIPTGEHVEVVREAAGPRERRRYRKRFLAGPVGDLRPWTARERRILEQLGAAEGVAVARLAPAAVADGTSLHTFDAGPSVDQWATCVRVRRNGLAIGSIFEECACWWSLARHCLAVLERLHLLGFVHLDLKADNVCIPWRQADAGDDPVPGRPVALHFEALTLIDVAWSLLPGVSLPAPLPLERQPQFAYQSPRLLEALEQGRRGNLYPAQTLDWRCDLFSLAAMLWRYLPEPGGSSGSGWTADRHAQATAFVRLLVDADLGPLPTQRPHAELIVVAEKRLREPELASALRAGFTFEAELAADSATQTPPTLLFRPADAVVAVAALAPAAGPSGPPSSAESPRSDPAPRGALKIAELPVLPSSAPQEAVELPAVDLLLADLAPGEPASVDLHLPDLGLDAASVDWGSHFGETVEPDPVDLHLPDLTAPPAESRPVGLHPADLVAPAAMAPPVDPPPVAAPPVDPPPTHSPQLDPAATRVEPTWIPEDLDPVLSGRPPADAALAPEPGRHRRARRDPAPIVAIVAMAMAVAVAAWWGVESGRLDMPWRTLAPTTALAERATTPAPQSAPEAVSRVPVAPPVPSSAPMPDADVPSNLPPRRPGEPPIEIFLPSAPQTTLPSAEPAAKSGETAIAGDFDGVARQLMRGPIVRRAPEAERQLARVLAAAAEPPDRRSADEVRALARAVRQGVGAAPFQVAVASTQARRLNEAARVAYWKRGNIPEAVKLQTRAFGANPLDTEVVGNLAFLRLREDPPEPEAARTLALHALTLKDDRFPIGRVEDWTTLAIANALTGREIDARNAWFVTMAISNDLQRHCKAAVRAQAIYGDKLRSSVQSMLERARASPGYARCGAETDRGPGTAVRPGAVAASPQRARRGG